MLAPDDRCEFAAAVSAVDKITLSPCYSMFEDFTARTTKIGQLYADLGKQEKLSFVFDIRQSPNLEEYVVRGE